MGRHALVLGTATHPRDRGLAGLPAVRHDVDQLKAALDYAGDFDSVAAHIDLSRSELTTALDEFYGARRHGDMALLYFSGHGLLHPDRSSLFLATTDTEQSQLHATAVDTAAVLKDLLSRTRASQKVVILDCCFSGAFTGGNRFKGGVREEPRGGLRHNGTFILTSSTHTRASFAQGADRPSVFTEVLLDGLRGGANVRSGSTWLTTHDLSHYVQKAMLRRSKGSPCESSEGVTEPIPIVAVDPEPGDRSHDSERSPSASPNEDDAPFDADRWRQLTNYYIACIERSAVLQAFIDTADRSRYEAMPAGREPVFAHAGPPFGLSGPQAALARRTAEAGGELRYGYPIVVRQGQAGSRRPQFVPLLECDAAVGQDDTLHTTMPPRINVALAKESGLSDQEIDDVTTRIEETFVAGDVAAVTSTIRLVSEVLGIPPAVPINPTALSGTVASGPLRRLQNSAVLMSVDSSRTAESQLLEDLRKELASKPGTIAGTALGALADMPGQTVAAPGRLPAAVQIVSPDRLNEAQESVIQAAMINRLTVAQGPPGTGKSQLVTALVATATAAGQTVLVGSTNNRAVSEVSDRCTNLVGPGLIVRSGNKEYQSQEPKLLASLIAAHSTGPIADVHTPAGELRVSQQEIQRLRRELDARSLIERDLAELAGARGELAVSANPLPDNESEMHQLLKHADRGLRHVVLGWWSRRRLQRIGITDREQLQMLADRVSLELRWRAGQQLFAALPDERDEWRRLRELAENSRPSAGRSLLAAQIATRVRTQRVVLQRRSDEMSGPSPRSWSRFAELLTALPAWAVTALSARKLPPTPALFDLVIVDEAAACNIPAVLPLLYRAERALIIGDPRQLAPVVPLPTSEDDRHQRAAGIGSEWLNARRLTFTRHSAYDAFAAATEGVHFLDEHYRCHPDIIAAPNSEVYQGRLTVLTDPSNLAVQVEPTVVWQDVAGQYARGSSGSGYNTPESSAAVAEVIRLRGKYPNATVGVVTPLAAQLRQLERGLRNAGLVDEVVCGTVHRFQGGERDIMVISPVGSSGITESARNWLVGQANLWNVAITRAKAHLVVVGDRSWWASQRGMLAAIAGGSNTEDSRESRTTAAADFLHAAAMSAGLSVHRDVTIAGHRYDLLMSAEHGTIAVLVDDPMGDANGRRLRRTLATLDVASHHAMVRRVPAWRCMAEPATVIEELSAALTP